MKNITSGKPGAAIVAIGAAALAYLAGNYELVGSIISNAGVCP